MNSLILSKLDNTFNVEYVTCGDSYAISYSLNCLASNHYIHLTTGQFPRCRVY